MFEDAQWVIARNVLRNNIYIEREVSKITVSLTSNWEQMTQRFENFNLFDIDALTNLDFEFEEERLKNLMKARKRFGSSKNHKDESVKKKILSTLLTFSSFKALNLSISSISTSRRFFFNFNINKKHIKRFEELTMSIVFKNQQDSITLEISKKKHEKELNNENKEKNNKVDKNEQNFENFDSSSTIDKDAMNLQLNVENNHEQEKNIIEKNKQAR